MKWSRIRWVLRILSVAIVPPLAFLGLRWGTGNFGSVEPGQIYRSAQLSARGLSRTIHDYRIATVLNLRGSNPDQSWYEEERKATLRENAIQIDFPMSSDQWLSREQAVALIDLLKNSPRPILIHCEWGAERTGLASAIGKLLKEGMSLEQARAEFSPYYLFAPMKDGLIMRGHLDAYEAWLQSRKTTHTPAHFEFWVAHEYQPGSPSREHWPCNPYPLKVVSRPASSPISTWGEKVCR